VALPDRQGTITDSVAPGKEKTKYRAKKNEKSR